MAFLVSPTVTRCYKIPGVICNLVLCKVTSLWTSASIAAVACKKTGTNPNQSVFTGLDYVKAHAMHTPLAWL